MEIDHCPTAPAVSHPDALKRAWSASLAPPLLGLILVAYTVLALAYAHFTPAWQSPDEPAHYNYVKYLADRGQLPVLRPGDYPAALVPIGPRKRPVDISPFRYESHQPPLFYALGALIYKLGGRLMALRTLSIAFGAGVVALAYRCARRVAPDSPWIWIGATAFVAFIPMHLFIAASVDNDSLAELVLSGVLLLYLSIAGGWTSRWRWPLLGLLLGLAVLAKETIWIPAAALGLASVVATRKRRGVVGSAGIVALVALAVSGWWFVRNGLIYGWNDPFALRRQATVAAGQIRATSHGLGFFSRFARVSFNSFWDQFGWMSIPAAPATYLKLEALSGLIVLGLLVLVARSGRDVAWGLVPHSSAPPRLERGGWTLVAGLGICWAGVLAGDVIYNWTFLQPQGRYLFPALIPVSIAASAGVAALFPRWLKPGAMALLGLGLLWLSVYSLRSSLIPAFAG
ncbi:MAG: DUF2142 domain-containing protein [Chloroflexota bacterium]